MVKIHNGYKINTLILMIAIIIVFIMFNIVYASSDILEHWGRDVIQDWLDRGLISGYPDGSFKPDNEITRAEFITLINKIFGYTETTTIDYSDVNIGDWYYESIAVAKAAGYIDGYPDGTMRPNNLISREEVATIIMKVYKLIPNEAAADVLTDAKTFTWSKGAIGAVLNADIMTGYPDGSFGSQIYMKRAESTVSLDRGNKKFMNTEEEDNNPVTPEAPEVVLNDEKDTVYGMTPEMEYKLDLGDWIKYEKSIFNKLDLSGEHILLVRYMAEGINPPGPFTKLEFTKRISSGSDIIEVTDIIITGDDTVDNYLTIQLTASVEPENATNKTVIWTVSTLLDGIATIDDNGLLTAIEPGTVTVMVTTSTLEVTRTKVITITNIAVTNATEAVLTAETTPTQSNVDDAQLLIDILPDVEIKTVLQNRLDVVQNIIDLAIAKETAIDTLQITYNTLYADIESSYTEENWITLTDYYNDGISNINEAGTIDLVDLALAEALNGMAEVKTIAQTLSAAKIAAHAALNDALAGYDSSNYTEFHWTAINNLKESADTAIDEATTVNAVNERKDDAIQAMSEIPTLEEVEEMAEEAVLRVENGTPPTEDDISIAYVIISRLPEGDTRTNLENRVLAALKTNALNDLDAAYGLYNSADYTSENWDILDGYYTTGQTEINSATNRDEIDEAYTIAFVGMAYVPKST